MRYDRSMLALLLIGLMTTSPQDPTPGAGGAARPLARLARLALGEILSIDIGRVPGGWVAYINNGSERIPIEATHEDRTPAAALHALRQLDRGGHHPRGRAARRGGPREG